MDATSKQCPLCGEWILRVAVRCKHCHADLHAYQVGAGPTGAQVPGQPPTFIPGASLLPGVPGIASPGAASGPSIAGAPGNPSLGADVPAGAPGPADGPSRREYVAPREGDFEQRFLDFAFKTALPISAVTVAYALKIPIKEAADGLEDLAARDVLLREVDEHGGVTFQLPGRQQIAAEMGPLAAHNPGTALSPYSQPPPMLYEPSMALTRTPPESTALAGLLVNVLLLPGLGSLIGGKTNAGIFQLLMFLLGFALCLQVIGVVIGGPMIVGAWIWGLVSGVNMLSEAKAAASQQRQLAG